MNKQTLAVVVGAIVLFAIGAFGAIAFTGNDAGSNGNMHTMEDGSTMQGDTTMQGETTAP